MIVRQDDLAAQQAFVQGLGIAPSHPFVGLIVEDDDGSFVGAFAFNGYDEINVDMSVILAKPVAVSAVRAIAEYVFRRLGVRRVTCVTATTNQKAINRLIRLGFECEGVLKERLPQGDAFIFGLLASRQRFLRLTADAGSQSA